MTAGRNGDAFPATASRYKTGMRLVVAVLAAVLALAPAAGATSATVAHGDHGPVCVQDGAQAGDSAR